MFFEISFTYFFLFCLSLLSFSYIPILHTPPYYPTLHHTTPQKKRGCALLTHPQNYDNRFGLFYYRTPNIVLNAILNKEELVIYHDFAGIAVFKLDVRYARSYWRSVVNYLHRNIIRVDRVYSNLKVTIIVFYCHGSIYHKIQLIQISID